MLGKTCVYNEAHSTFIRVQRLETAPEDVLIRRSFTRTALEAQVDEVFWSAYRPRAMSKPATDLFFPALTGDVLVLREHWASEKAVWHACSASAFLCEGRMRSNPELVYYSAQVYGISLREIRRLIQDPCQQLNDAVLASCRMISLYELFRHVDGSKTSSQSIDWQNHVDGMCRLVELRGPSRHMEGSGHVLFQETRLLAIRLSLMRRRPSIFASPEWRTDPWKESPFTIQDELFDLMLQIAGLLQTQDALFSDIVPCTRDIPATSLDIRFETTGKSLLSDFLTLAKNLRAWEENVIALHCKEHIYVQSKDRSHNNLLGIAMAAGYNTLFAASHYWTACVVVHSQLHVTISHLRNYLPPDILPSVPLWIDPFPHAADIIHSAPRLSNPEAGLWGLSHSAFPLVTALQLYSVAGRISDPEIEILVRLYENGLHTGILKGFMSSVMADAPLYPTSGKTTLGKGS